MRTWVLSLIVVLGLSSFSASFPAQEKGGDDRTGPYDVAVGWPRPLPDKGYIWGSTGGIFAETPNRIFIANRGELKLPDKLPANFTGFWGSFGQQVTIPTPIFKNCIVVVDSTGKLVEAWNQWDQLFEDGVAFQNPTALRSLYSCEVLV